MVQRDGQLPRKGRAVSNENGRRRGLVAGIGGFLLGVVLTVLFLIFFATHPQGVTSSTAANPDISVTLSDSYMTRAANLAIQRAGHPVPIGNVRAHTSVGDTPAVSGDAVGGLSQLRVVAQLLAQNGNLAVAISSADLGGLALPQPAIDALDAAINDQLQQVTNKLTLSGAHYDVTGVNTADGLVTVTIDMRH